MGEILVGRSAQRMKHENAAQNFAKFIAHTSARVIKICRRNFALGNVRRNFPIRSLKAQSIREVELESG